MVHNGMINVHNAIINVHNGILLGGKEKKPTHCSPQNHTPGITVIVNR